MTFTSTPLERIAGSWGNDTYIHINMYLFFNVLCLTELKCFISSMCSLLDGNFKRQNAIWDSDGRTQGRIETAACTFFKNKQNPLMLINGTAFSYSLNKQVDKAVNTTVLT